MNRIIILMFLSATLLTGCNNPADEQAKKVNITYTLTEQNPSGTTVVDVVFNIENVYNTDITAVKFKSTIILADLTADTDNMLLDKVIRIGETNSRLTLHKEYGYTTGVERIKIENVVAEVKNSGQL